MYHRKTILMDYAIAGFVTEPQRLKNLYLITIKTGERRHEIYAQRHTIYLSELTAYADSINSLTLTDDEMQKLKKYFPTMIPVICRLERRSDCKLTYH